MSRPLIEARALRRGHRLVFDIRRPKDAPPYLWLTHLSGDNKAIAAHNVPLAQETYSDNVEVRILLTMKQALPPYPCSVPGGGALQIAVIERDGWAVEANLVLRNFLHKDAYTVMDPGILDGITSVIFVVE